MKVALCSDERYPVQDTLQRELSARGHSVVLFGALASGKDEPWAEAAESAALSVARGECQQGVFSCWSGTGISMAANKVPGIRAALCTDAGTVRAARLWNDANVLCLSNRLLSDDLAKELLAAWFEAVDSAVGADGVAKLRAVEARYRAEPG
jgi:ribose 5-phosphate isomerase B